MSSDPSSEFNVQRSTSNLFSKRLIVNTSNKHEQNLLDNRLIIRLESCDSADVINAILQERAQTFYKFRVDDGKLTRWVKRTVHVSHTQSSSGTLGAAVGLVRWKPSARNFLLQGLFLKIYNFHAAIPTCTSPSSGIGALLAVCVISSIP